MSESASQDLHAHKGGAIVSHVEHSKLLPWLMLNCLLSGSAIVGVIVDMIQSSHTERETRMLEYYTLEMDAKLIAAGVKKPAESVAGQLDKSHKE